MSMSKNRHRIREFEALRAVITTGTTIGAARRLGVSQPAVSRSLSQLEGRIGHVLFTRSSGRIEPTAEALRMNATLDPLFEALARIDGADWVQSDDEPLRLAVPSSLAHHFVISRLASFLNHDHTRRVQMAIQTTEQIVGGVADLRFDIGLTSAMIQRAGVKLVPWRRAQVACVMTDDHPLADRMIIRPIDLDGVSMVGFVRRMGTRALTDQIFARAGVRPRIVVETATNMSAVDLVRQGVGVTLVNPFPLFATPQDGLQARPFDADITYQTSFVLSAERPPTALARSFMRHIKLTTPNDPISEAM